MNIKRFLAYTLCALLTGSNAFAAGFQLRYQSAEAMGTAFSSAGTTGQSLSQTYFNPASYFLMNKEDKKNSFGAEGLLILPLTTEAETDATGNSTDGFGSVTFAPSFFYARMLNDKTALTISLTTPWGTSTDYDSDWDGRYHALETYLGSFNLSPAVSRKINDKLILTGGLQVQYLFGTLSTAIDGGTPGAIAGVPGAAPQANDVKSEFDGTSLGFGFTLGATYKLSDNTTLAFNYISAIKNELDGSVKFSNLTGGAATDTIIGANFANSSDAQLEIKTPDLISLGVSHIFSEKVTGHFSTNYATWSSFENLETKINGAVASTIPQDWDDTFFVSGGATIKMNDNLILRTGMFYENGAPGDLRSPRTLDTDKLGLALGASKTFGKVKMDLALNQIVYIGDFDIDLPVASGIPGTEYAGEMNASVTLLRAGLTYNW